MVVYKGHLPNLTEDERDRHYRGERRYRVSKLYLGGMSIGEISDREKMTPSEVKAELNVLRRIWLRKATSNVAERKAKELAKLDNLESMAWEAWHHSCENSERLKVFTTSRPKSKGSMAMQVLQQKMSKEVIGRSGNPKYLEMVARCIETRCKILGMFAKDAAVTNNNVFINWDEVATPQEPKEVTSSLFVPAGLTAPTAPANPVDYSPQETGPPSP